MKKQQKNLKKTVEKKNNTEMENKMLVLRSRMFKRLDKNQEGGELVLSNKINTLKVFQNFID